MEESTEGFPVVEDVVNAILMNYGAVCANILEGCAGEGNFVEEMELSGIS